jgi:hypothetical protein
MYWIRKKRLGVTLALLGMGMGAHRAYAASTDTITISLTPNTTYAVTISSPYTSGYNFGLVNLNATTVSTLAITLTNSGSIYEYFGISVSNTSGGGNPWTTTGVAPSTDTFRMSGQLNASQPAQGSGNFTALTNSDPTNVGGLYGQANTKTSPTAGSNTQKLWLQMETPFTLNTGGSGAQTMTVSVTGQAT